MKRFEFRTPAVALSAGLPPPTASGLARSAGPRAGRRRQSTLTAGFYYVVEVCVQPRAAGTRGRTGVPSTPGLFYMGAARARRCVRSTEFPAAALGAAHRRARIAFGTIGGDRGLGSPNSRRHLRRHRFGRSARQTYQRRGGLQGPSTRARTGPGRAGAQKAGPGGPAFVALPQESRTSAYVRAVGNLCGPPPERGRSYRRECKDGPASIETERAVSRSCVSLLAPFHSLPPVASASEKAVDAGTEEPEHRSCTDVDDAGAHAWTIEVPGSMEGGLFRSTDGGHDVGRKL